MTFFKSHLLFKFLLNLYPFQCHKSQHLLLFIICSIFVPIQTLFIIITEKKSGMGLLGKTLWGDNLNPV